MIYDGKFGNTIARITDIRTSFGIEVPILYMYDRNEEIIGDYNETRPIKTEEKHLLAMGFTIQYNNNNPYYTLNNIIIATISIEYPDPNSITGKGYVFCGFRAKLNQMVKDEILKSVSKEYNEITFSKVFAPAVFLMQLFDFLDQNDVEYNKELIALIK